MTEGAEIEFCGAGGVKLGSGFWVVESKSLFLFDLFLVLEGFGFCGDLNEWIVPDQYRTGEFQDYSARIQSAWGRVKNSNGTIDYNVFLDIGSYV